MPAPNQASAVLVGEHWQLLAMFGKLSVAHSALPKRHSMLHRRPVASGQAAADRLFTLADDCFLQAGSYQCSGWAISKGDVAGKHTVLLRPCAVRAWSACDRA